MNLDVKMSFQQLMGPDPVAVPSPTNLSEILHLAPGEARGCDSNGTDEYESFYNTSQFVTGLIIYPILCITGVLGNSLSLIVLSHKDMATSTNIYLLGK
ncbi:unnamed protein product [Lymnaea stagnalis]|uniref:Uncharacterized protein n=1 Tax=Lymnaea stagnalis TaxID=6523 RepID=A0AAV2IKR3_LYMST